jgi:hypothetical protein
MLDANSVKRFERALDAKEEDLLSQKAKVRAFVRSDHSSGEALEYQRHIQDSEAQIDAILASLLAERVTPEGYSHAAKELCRRCSDLQGHVRDMATALANDLNDRRRVEEMKSIDVVKHVTFLLSTAARNGVGGGHVDVTQAAAAGFGISVAIVARKRIAERFRAAGKTMCEFSDRIEHSFALYYAKQTVNDGTNAIRKTLAAGRRGVAIRLPKMASRAFGQLRKPVKKLVS